MVKIKDVDMKIIKTLFTKNYRKGESPLSESTLAIISLIISFILIAIFASSILSTQASVAFNQAANAIARDIAIAIDRACGLAGSTKIEYEIPKGVKLNISIDYKSVLTRFDSSQVLKSFSCMRLASKVSFVEPSNICIVKNRNDRKVFVIEGKCKCKINDGTCDPACAAENICDPDCYKKESDNICLGICVKNNDGICDPDCYRNESDYVWDLDCRNKEKDNICDPDSHNVTDGVCDPDCYTKESVICDPDCKPKDENNDKEEDEKDGFCYTACLNYTSPDGKKFLPKDGICDKDCEEENGICDPDCTKDKDCKMQCSKLGENCSSLPPCPGEGICCPGDKIVRKNCCGNGICEPREMWLPANETRWENFLTCRQDCDSNATDGFCARIADNICDPDCVEKFNRDRPNDYSFCDPDCIPNANGICPYAQQQSIQDGMCIELSDNICDPDCVNDTLRCDPDCCGGFNVANPCSASPGCHCPTRANMSSNFNGAFWFQDTNNEPDCNRHNPRITQGVIEICSQEAINFINRRGWDIKDIARSLKTYSPEGFAFDHSRYETILNGVQKASVTIKANEEYNLTEKDCCCRSDCGCPNCINSSICCGVGFCGDHGVAVLSILRTLGIPAKDVFDTFTGTAFECYRHSFVVYRCDPNLPEYMKLDECQNNWNRWLIVDATQYFIEPLSNHAACSNLCIWWNDYGVYPTIDPNIYGFGGKISATTGRPFPQETGCSVGGACAMQRVCDLFKITCIS